MTVSTQTDEVVYTGNGATVEFDFTWPGVESQVKAKRITIASGEELELANPADFTVEMDAIGVGLWPTGGVLTTVATLSSDYQLKIYRDPEFTQTLQLRTQGAFRPEDLERAYDLSVMRDLRLESRIEVAEEGLADLDAAIAAAEAAQAAAEAAQTAAETAETNAETAETNAETAETNAEAAAAAAAASAASIAGLSAVIARAITVPSPEVGFDIPNAATRASKVLGFDGAGAVTVVTPGTNGVQQVADRNALDALTGVQLTGAAVIYGEGGRNGLFRWDSSNLSAQVTADPQQGIYVPPTSAPTGASGAWVRVHDNKVYNPRWFGALGDGATNDRAAIQACIDLAGVGGVTWLPPGTYRINTLLTLINTGAVLAGSGNYNTFIQANFGTTHVINIGNVGSPPENITVQDLQFSHNVTRTADETIRIDYALKTLIRNVRVHNAWVGMTIGVSGVLQSVNEAKFQNCFFSCMNNGVTIYAPAGIRFESVDLTGYLSGAPSSPSPGHGIQIVGAADGVWIDDLCTIQTFSRGVIISHASGSCASVECHGKLAFNSAHGFSIECSGTASINGVFIKDAEIVGRGATGSDDGVFINETSSGSMSGIVIDGVEFTNCAQRVIYVVTACGEVAINNCMSRTGGTASAGSYSAVDFNSNATDRVVMTGCFFRGSHNYGANNWGAVAEFCITNCNMAGSSGVLNNMGATGVNRKYRAIVGIADAG